MQALNLPSFSAHIKGSAEQALIFDRLRRKYVVLTPEEWVRQHFVNFLIEYKGYPPTLLSNEVTLSIGDKTLRADTVVYDKSLRAQMIIEYKAPTVTLSEKVLQQITAYNSLLHVDYLVVSNGLRHYCCRIDSAINRPQFLSDIPGYDEIGPKK